MAIVLHRFPLSHFSEKGRALLAYKRVDYRFEEHRLGLPQLRIRRLSGQRKLPVIEHDDRVVADSTAIGLYLDEQFPEPALLPKDPERRREVLELEDRIDHVFGKYAPVVWFDWLVRERPRDVARLIAAEVAGVGRGRLAGLAVSPLMRLPPARRIVEKSEARTRAMLSELTERLSRSRYLTGEVPTLADIAAAALPLHLEFPNYRELAIPDWAGMGVPGYADSPEFARFFEWRRALYRELLA